MKTTVLMTTLFLVTGATFAQDVTSKTETASKVQIKSTPADNQVSSNSAASSAVTASGSTVIVDKTAAKADRTKKEIKEEVKAQKKAVKDEVKGDVKAIKQAAQENREVTANVNSGVGIHATANNNEVSKEAAVNAQTAVSSEGALRTVKKINTTAKTTADQKTAAVIETGNAVKTGVKSGIHKVSGNVKPVKVNTRLQANVKAGAGPGIQ